MSSMSRGQLFFIVKNRCEYNYPLYIQKHPPCDIASLCISSITCNWSFKCAIISFLCWISSSFSFLISWSCFWSCLIFLRLCSSLQIINFINWCNGTFKHMPPTKSQCITHGLGSEHEYEHFWKLANCWRHKWTYLMIFCWRADFFSFSARTASRRGLKSWLCNKWW